jgi:hypothetical protein
MPDTGGCRPKLFCVGMRLRCSLNPNKVGRLANVAGCGRPFAKFTHQKHSLILSGKPGATETNLW